MTESQDSMRKRHLVYDDTTVYEMDPECVAKHPGCMKNTEESGRESNRAQQEEMMEENVVGVDVAKENCNTNRQMENRNNNNFAIWVILLLFLCR